MKKNRIFIACDDERLRIALLLFLEEKPGTTVIGFTDRLESLLPQLDASQADILLLEWQMTSLALIDLLSKVHNLPHPPKIIYLCRCTEEEEKIGETSADYVLVMDSPPDKLLSILDQIDP
jgi:DNA-binding NarL/FixJ family response regulator